MNDIKIGDTVRITTQKKKPMDLDPHCVHNFKKGSLVKITAVYTRDHFKGMCETLSQTFHGKDCELVEKTKRGLREIITEEVERLRNE